MSHQQQDISIEEKLRSLYDLQLIDRLIDDIRSIINNIPLQVKAIENEVENIQKKYKEIKEEIKEYDKDIQNEKNLIKEHEIFIKKNASKQDKEQYSFEAKEIEFKELEIELCHKKWKKIQFKKDKKKKFYVSFVTFYEKKKEYLSNKKKEFSKILEIQEKKKFFLLKKYDFFSKKIESRLLRIYSRIRERTQLAIVPIRTIAPLCSFFTIPVQKCLDIAQRNKIIVDEHSGRILIDPVLAEEEAYKILTYYKKFII